MRYVGIISRIGVLALATGAGLGLAVFIIAVMLTAVS